VLAADPDHPDGLHLLGVIAHQGRRHDLAVELITRAVKRNAKNPVYFYNLGNALKGQGKLDEAIAAYRRAIRLKPDSAEAHYNLGNALKEQGKLDESVAAYRQTIRFRPSAADAHSNLGLALHAKGKLAEGVAACREAIRIKPDYAEGYVNLGLVLQGQKKLDEAVSAYREAIRIKPNYPVAHYNLGAVLQQRGRPTEAVDAYRQAIRIKPDYAEAHRNHGVALGELGRFDEAVAAYRRALEINAVDAAALSNLGNALRILGKIDESVAAHREAIRINPDLAVAYTNLGLALQDQAKLDEAAVAFRKAMSLDPEDANVHSALLFSLNYDDKATVESVFAAHREWNERHCQRIPRTSVHVERRDAGRRLKVGYVSPDLMEHSVAFFVEPLLRQHDRQVVEVFCYAEVKRPDTVTARLQGYADRWRMTAGLSDDELAEKIRADGIDILVDLAGHTGSNRLRVFARKPAPLQMTWLGYPNTTGLDAIDYRLVDAVTDPVGEADAWASEALVRLESGFLCYGAPSDAPEPAPPPCLTTGKVTFGSFNNPAKLSPATLDAWAALLARLPDARLLLKGRAFADPDARASFFSRLGKLGVAADRVELAARSPLVTTHLALYDRLDIALDPFPYNGTTTTCEALWMGVPVVTLRGDRHAGRVGASLLNHIGMTELIAGSVDEYVQIASALAASPARLRDLRQVLRPRLAASPLCDAPAFARKIEAAYRAAWQRWCENQQK
jgi:predicted O-linked N-acetylglucosamine transferase (SPINDLY family)